MTSRIAVAAIVALSVGGASYSMLDAQTAPSVWDGVYTDAQATRGAALFDRECAGCHGPNGEGGGMAPALIGAAFTANYDGQTVGDLFERNRTTMPVGREGQLNAQANADITAFMLQVNKFPAGDGELPAQSMALKQIAFVAERPATPQQGDRPPGTHQDNTDGKEWIRRLERPSRSGDGRIAIVEQGFDDPVAKKWDAPEDRITSEQGNAWMGHAGFRLEATFDLFNGANNPRGTGMPERWFVLYTREAASAR